MSAQRKLLAIDTAWAACSVAVAGPDGFSVWRHEPMTTGHAERLFPMIEEVMAEASWAFRDLEAIAVTIGPGSFTGVRVGVAAARGLALASGLPTFAATSLAPIARLAAKVAGDEALSAASKTGVTVVQDARRGNVFVQDFDHHGQAPTTEARIVPVTELPDLDWPSRDQILTGTAASLLGQAVPEVEQEATVVSPTENMPTAVALTEVDLLEMHPVKPLYLRPPDAKAQVGKSLLRQSK